MSDVEDLVLYRHWHDETLLYVGVSISALTRIAQHRAQSSWYSEVNRITLERFPTREALYQAEQDAIQREHPKYNKAGVTSPYIRGSSHPRRERVRHYGEGVGMGQRERAALEREVGRLERSMYEAELTETVADITRLREELAQAVAHRDDIIRTIYRSATTRSLIKLTGLSRDRLYTIAGRPMVADRDGSGV